MGHTDYDYHAIMMGEDGIEFGADVEANSYDEAETLLRDGYPESRIIYLESYQTAVERERRIYNDVRAGRDYDEDGNPFYPHGDLAAW